MNKIRCGLYETNSSTCHSLIIVKVSELEKWKQGGYLFIDKDEDEGKVYSLSELASFAIKEASEKGINISYKLLEELVTQVEIEEVLINWFDNHTESRPYTYEAYCNEYRNPRGDYQKFCLSGIDYAIFIDEYAC